MVSVCDAFSLAYDDEVVLEEGVLSLAWDEEVVSLE